MTVVTIDLKHLLLASSQLLFPSVLHYVILMTPDLIRLHPLAISIEVHLSMNTWLLVLSDIPLIIH